MKLCRGATSPENWHALVACAVEGVTNEAFAEQEGVTVNAIEWRLRVARRELRAALLRHRNTLGHPERCPCWRCAELRGEGDPLRDFRGRAADPTECDHPEDWRFPTSGDGAMCGVCGADCDPLP